MKKTYRIGIIPGDGIGKEVIQAAQHVLETINSIAKTFSLAFFPMEVGEAAIEKYGNPLPKETLDKIGRMDASLFGAAHTFPVIPGLRHFFDLYAKVCPVKALPAVNMVRPDADLIIVRENTEGLYRGVGYIDREQHVNLRVFTQRGMERIIRFSFNVALKQKRSKVTFTHKAEVLKYTDGQMREIFYEIAKEYPTIGAEDMMIDACAATMIMKPERLDVVLTENSNGDILSDVGAAITGGLGLAPSANVGDSVAIFEPIHGTAPKHTGKNVANPIAAILSSRMMLDHLGETEAGNLLERAVKDILAEGRIRTYDIGGHATTSEFAEAVSGKLVTNWDES
jgi:isopropylmalate/isohomocitrate dehydrogenase-like protein